MLDVLGRRKTELSSSRWWCTWPEKHNVLVHVEELETYILSSTDADGILDVSAWNAYDHRRRRRLIALKTMEATLVANAKQYATMRARQDEECQDFHEIIEYMNERQERLVEKSWNFEKFYVKRLGSWTTGSWRREWNCWRKVAAEGGVTRMAAAGFQSSRSLTIPKCPRWSFIGKRLGGGSEILWPYQGAAVERDEWGGDTDVSAPPLNYFDQNMEAGDDEHLEELGFVPSAVSEPRWAKSFNFFQNCGYCDKKEGAAHTTNSCRNCIMNDVRSKAKQR